MYFKSAQEAESRAELVRQTVFTHEQLTAASIREQADVEEEAG
jgi:hypothetical protein